MDKKVCAFYVTRKKRFCKMSPNAGEIFCNQHMPVNVELSSGRKRLPCPLDSKHSCFEDELQDHMSRCNARSKPHPHYYEENINSGYDDEKCNNLKVALKDVPTDRLISVLNKLDKFYNEYAGTIQNPEFQLSDENFVQDGKVNTKHTKQNESLLLLLKINKLSKDGMAFVEFGAGRGRLTQCIIDDLKPSQKSLFILVDRASQRHKFDNKYKEELRIERIKIDIKHLNLAQLPSLLTCEEMIIISKHLCGSATDLTLRCLTNYMVKRHTCKIAGTLIALCCHHRCEWHSYVGKEFLKQCDFHQEDFDVLLSISSWATCGSRTEKSAIDPSLQNVIKYGIRNIMLFHKGDEEKLNITDLEQTNYGLKSKLLLDQGRIAYLKENQLKTTLVYYTDKCTSLENVALLATRK